MINYKYIFCCLLFPFFIRSTTIAQKRSSAATYSPVTIGQTIPNFSIRVYGQKKGMRKKLADFSAPLLLVDFWATWCGSCIAAFPKMEKFKKTLGRDFNVLLVTDEKDSIVTQFIRQRKEAERPIPDFPVITADTVFKKLFPHESIPHYVWIDRKGIVRAITNAAELTETNIRDAIAQKKLTLPLKDDAAREAFHDPAKPLFINGNGGDGHAVRWHSVLSGFVDGMRNVSMFGTDGSMGYVQELNVDIFTLYKTAYSDDTAVSYARLPNSRIVFRNVQDSLPYFVTYEGMKKISGQQYCYSLWTPVTDELRLRKIMQDDMDRYFHLKVYWEKRTMPSLVLTAEDTLLIRPLRLDSLSLDQKSSNLYSYSSLNNLLKYFRVTLSSGYLGYSPYPIIDETGYKGQAYFSIKADMSNWESIDKALSQYKMHLRLENREVNVLVVEVP